MLVRHRITYDLPDGGTHVLPDRKVIRLRVSCIATDAFECPKAGLQGTDVTTRSTRLMPSPSCILYFLQAGFGVWPQPSQPPPYTPRLPTPSLGTWTRLLLPPAHSTTQPGSSSLRGTTDALPALDINKPISQPDERFHPSSVQPPYQSHPLQEFYKGYEGGGPAPQLQPALPLSAPQSGHKRGSSDVMDAYNKRHRTDIQGPQPSSAGTQ